jgi:predicted kinase
MLKLKDLLKDILSEGVDDPGILKAVFLAGGPGSGKSYLASNLFGIPEKINISATGLKMVNQDKELENLLDKYGFGHDLDNMPEDLFRQLTDPDYEHYSSARTFTKELSKKRLRHYTNGRLGVIIDGTGHRYGKIASQKKKLEKIGYDSYMIFVNTSLEVALQRNQSRDRVVPEDIVKKSWSDVQNNLGKFQGLFGNNFIVVDNSKFLKPKEAQKKFSMLTKKYIDKFVKKPVKNKQGKEWIKKQRILKKR